VSEDKTYGLLEMLDLRAAHRLAATNLKSPVVSYKTLDSTEDAGDQLEAGFDKLKDPELQKIEMHMRKASIFFTLASNHLYHKSNSKDVEREAEMCADELNKLDYQLRIQSGIFSKPSFALKGKDGIVLQKLSNNLRIFFSV